MKSKEDLKNAAKLALKEYMGVTEDETLLVITDAATNDVGRALYEAGLELCEEAFYLEMREREVSGQEPPPQIAELMQKVDVVMCPTAKSLTHTKARIYASKQGVRVGTMPGINAGIMKRCFSADPQEIISTNEKLQKILRSAKEVKLVSKAGTDAIFSASGRKIISSTGVLRNIGEGGNVPSGEVYFAPAEGVSNGKLVIDGSVSGIGLLEEPVFIDLVNGFATNIAGGKQAKILSDMLSKVGHYAHAVAEFGIGTNPKAKISGLILEDEKVLGTVHIAFGNNLSMGGSINVPIHIDCVIKSPSFYCDGTPIMIDGKLIV